MVEQQRYRETAPSMSVEHRTSVSSRLHEHAIPVVVDLDCQLDVSPGECPGLGLRDEMIEDPYSVRFGSLRAFGAFVHLPIGFGGPKS